MDAAPMARKTATHKVALALISFALAVGATAVGAPQALARPCVVCVRAAVEREFGRLKNEWALAPLRVRGIDRVRLRADLTILAKLACALARAVPLAA